MSAPRIRLAPFNIMAFDCPRAWMLLARVVGGIGNHFPRGKPACAPPKSREEHAAYVRNLHHQKNSDAEDGRVEGGRPLHKAQNYETECNEKRKNGEGPYANESPGCDRYRDYDNCSGKYHHPSLCAPPSISPINPRFGPAGPQQWGIGRLYTLAFKIAIIKRRGEAFSIRTAQPTNREPVFSKRRFAGTDFIIASPAGGIRRG
jgi:hypothetical protein